MNSDLPCFLKSSDSGRYTRKEEEEFISLVVLIVPEYEFDENND